jgi:hypothetical protein
MKHPPEELRPENGAPKPTRTEQARQVVQEYIDDLRVFLKKLRNKMN